MKDNMNKEEVDKKNIKDNFIDIKKDTENPNKIMIKDTEFDGYMRG